MEEQRSAEWFAKRVGRVTGSRAGAILGMSKWQTPDDVMRAMVREHYGAESEFTGNIATSYGAANEGAAVMDFELETGLQVTETGFHLIEDWAGASPDGLIGDDAVLEIKCPYSKRESSEFLPLHAQPHYFAQCQFEMMATRRQKAYFYQWSPMGSSLEVVEYSVPWFEENLPKLRAFYERYIAELEAPDKHLLPLTKTLTSELAAARYTRAKEELAKATEELEAAKCALIALAGGEKANISGLLVYPINRKGAISYAKAIKEHLPDLDLEPYRGKESTTWAVK